MLPQLLSDHISIGVDRFVDGPGPFFFNHSVLLLFLLSGDDGCGDQIVGCVVYSPWTSCCSCEGRHGLTSRKRRRISWGMVV